MECTGSAECRWAEAAAELEGGCQAVAAFHAGVGASLAASLVVDGILTGRICLGCSEGGERTVSEASRAPEHSGRKLQERQIS